jgi:hypothetical protein
MPSQSQSPQSRSGDGLVDVHDSNHRRKKRKVTRACDSCRKKKKACNGEQPCSTCWVNKLSCSYLTSYTRGRATAPPVRPLNEELSSIASVSTIGSGTIEHQVDSQADEPAPTVLRLSSVGDTLQSDEDSSVRHIIHHDMNPILPQSAIESALPSRRQSPDAVAVAGQYLGPSSAHSFLTAAWKRLFDQKSGPAFPEDLGQGYDANQNVSIFAFGDRHGPEVDVSNFQMPPTIVLKALSETYFLFAAPSFRFLHQPTVSSWISLISDVSPPILSVSRQAIVLMVMASASLFTPGQEQDFKDAGRRGLVEGEVYCSLAQRKMAEDRGCATLEAVQARLLLVLYFLYTSRTNQAWYTNGTTIQLILALGLHRKRNIIDIKNDCIEKECARRTFWSQLLHLHTLNISMLM